MKIVAEARAVTKRFGDVTALDGVTMGVETGRMTGLVGPDGAGKTSLIRLLAGLLVPDAGEAIALGQPATRTDRSAIGYMPQRFGLYEDLTVAENLQLFAELRGLPAAERQERFGRLLDFTDLVRFQQRLAGKLSGGMKQKLGLACALIRQPTLLLLDEPGVGVDPVSRRELWEMVKALTGEGVGVLWSTAYLDEAEKCDVVHLLNEGKLLKSGAPSAFLSPVEKRVVRIPVASADRRSTLGKAMETSGVIDGAIQGDAIRLLLKDEASIHLLADLGRAEFVPPRFEDAFVDQLGGTHQGQSALAANYREPADRTGAPIVAERLTKMFGDFCAAQDISFTVRPGEIFGLLGPNGAGKSTTFKMLCGLLTPTRGQGSVAGYDLRTARSDARQSLGYMAQKFSLYGELSVAQNLDFFAGAYGLSGNDRRRAIGRVTDIFHLDRYLGDNAGTMPLGFKQRLALACAVMHEPPVLFLDEPTSGVDPIVRREFWTHINGLVERGIAVLVTTHFMDEAEYCDEIALIHRSRQIATGSPDELKRATGSATMEDAFIALIEGAGDAAEAA